MRFLLRQVAAQVYEFVLSLGSADDDGGAKAVAVLHVTSAGLLNWRE